MKTKHAVITGASSGIGAALVTHLISQQWLITGIGRNEDVLAETERGSPERFRFSRADVTDPIHVSSLSAWIQKDARGFGPIDALYQCAGGVPGDRLFYPLGETPPEVFEQTWRVNVFSKFLVARELFPLLRTGGCIINVGSISGETAFPNQIAYATAMGCVKSLSFAMDAELRQSGIRVATVSPGSVRTPLMRKLVEKGEFPAEELERALSPLEVAAAMQKLADQLMSGQYLTWTVRP